MKIEVFTSREITSRITTNRFFDAPAPSPADKIAELKALVAEVGTLITEGKAVIATVEEMITNIKVFLGK